MKIADVESQDEHDTLDGVPGPAATYALFGHEGPWSELIAAHRSGRLHHGWLLQGPRGIGKATTAFAFARHLLAADQSQLRDRPTSDPEGSIARQAASGAHPNLVHITRPAAERGGGFKTQITVEEIRKLNRFFRTTTGGGQWRIAIIDPADDMNRNAANALLKILEEPPERSVFLITNHMPGRLLPTIRSRCRVLRFDTLPDPDMVKTLSALPLDLGQAEIRDVVALAEGSVRTAVSLAVSGGLETKRMLDHVFDAAEPDWQEIQTFADALTQKGQETAFDLMTAALFKRLAGEAEALAAAGDRSGASRIASLWASESARIREGLAYNLDRKQLILTFFHALFTTRRALSAA